MGASWVALIPESLRLPVVPVFPLEMPRNLLLLGPLKRKAHRRPPGPAGGPRWWPWLGDGATMMVAALIGEPPDPRAHAMWEN